MIIQMYGLVLYLCLVYLSLYPVYTLSFFTPSVMLNVCFNTNTVILTIS